MSYQFGRWNYDGRPAAPEYIEKVRSLLAPYGPDGSSFYSNGGVHIICGAFHTTAPSHREKQLHVSRLTGAISWDGRLDNGAELVRELRDAVTSAATDLEVVVAAYERWGTACFAKLVGDWALSIWDAETRSVILAKDFAGIRPLFYARDSQGLTWSSVLEPLLLCAEHAFELEQEYVAGWLSLFPATHLTPWSGIRSVPPACFVHLKPDQNSIHKFWDFDPGKSVRYRADTDYEEHFRAAFGEAVRRRLRSGHPIAAELSGGMDSSSMVCMADEILACGDPAPHLETVSYYNDSEPNWNERPYFSKIEEKRGRVGCHIDLSRAESVDLAAGKEEEKERFAAMPGSGGRLCVQFTDFLRSRGVRVLLSGVGGDEATGGVPTPIPELQDLLVTFEIRRLAHQLKLWALDRRRSYLQLLLDVLRGFLPLAAIEPAQHRQPAPWLNPEFTRRYHSALQGYESRTRFFGALPSFQENLRTLEQLRRQLACTAVPREPLYEKRYPYLDRDLLEFLYAIPREQLVRPGQRRSLMRRALAGIVPKEVLERRRKAYVARGPIAAISQQSQSLLEMSRRMLSSSLGIIDAKRFAEELDKLRRGQPVPVVTLQRAIAIEFWLRELQAFGTLAIPIENAGDSHSPPQCMESMENKQRGAGRVTAYPAVGPQTNHSAVCPTGQLHGCEAEQTGSERATGRD